MAQEMWWKLVVICLFVIESESDCPNVKTELSGIRKRRHLTFPDGANFVMTISLVKAFMTHAPSGWNLALEIDVLFPLPDANFTNAEYRRKLHHRQKREFWERLENALEYHNFNGRACMLRGICEARQYLAPPGKSLVHDLLRVIFSMHTPTERGEGTLILKKNSQRVRNMSPVVTLNTAPLHETGFVEEVGGRYEDLLDPHVCSKVNDCPISLLQVVLALNKQKY